MSSTQTTESSPVDLTLEQALRKLTASQRKFLKCFAVTGSVIKASRWSKLHRQNHYDYLEESSLYRDCYERIQPQAAKMLEDEAIRRAHDGIRKAIRYKGKIVAYETEYSDGLLQFLLRGAMPVKYTDRTASTVTIEGNVIEKLNAGRERARLAKQESPE